MHADRFRSFFTPPAVAVLVATAFVVVATPAHAADSDVATMGELQTAVNTCVDGDTITLIADISDVGASINHGWCTDLTIDLNGFSLVARYISYGSPGERTLAIRDTAGGGSLTVDASAFANQPGISLNVGGVNHHLVIYGGTVTARGGASAAGIGGGWAGVDGSTVTIYGGTVNAFGGVNGAGIGGGENGDGGSITISGGTVVATGGTMAAGIGGGFTGDGGTVVLSGGTAMATGGYSAVGGGQNSTVFGTLDVGGLLRVPSGVFVIPDSAAGAEVHILSGGRIEGTVADATVGAAISGAGQILNDGAITLASVYVGVTVQNHNYLITFDAQGGAPTPAPVQVYATTFTDGVRAFPADPTRSGFEFAGWFTAPGVAGTQVTAGSVLTADDVLYGGWVLPMTGSSSTALLPWVLGLMLSGAGLLALRRRVLDR